MTYAIEFSLRAKRNLDALYVSIGAFYSPQADAWFKGLEALILRLGEYPRRGKVTDKTRDIRHLTYRSQSFSYRIFYRLNEKRRTVYVLHIRHGSRKGGGV